MRKRGIEKTEILILCMALIWGCSGCGHRKEVDYNIDQGSYADTLEAEPEAEIPDRLQYDIISDVTGMNISVSADVIYNDQSEGMPVVKLSQKRFTSEDMQNYADLIFDEGTAELYVPAAYLNQQGLADREVRLLNEMGKLSDTEVKGYYSLLEAELEEVKNAAADYDDSTPKKLDTVPEFFSDDEMNIDGIDDDRQYGICEFIGTVNEIPCQLTFMHDYAGESMTLLQRDYTDVRFYGISSEEGQTENICSYTKEEAVEMAEEYLIKLGLGDFTVTRVLDARARNVESETDQNGSLDSYKIFFGRAVNGMSTLYSELYSGRERLWGTSIEYGYEYIMVCVNDFGIVSLEYGNPMQVDEINTDSSVLLSFDKVDQIAKDYMQNGQDLGNDDVGSLCINEVELGLGRVRGEDGAYYLIPVWMYFDTDTDMIFQRDDILTINAIDGTLIDTREDGKAIPFGR